MGTHQRRPPAWLTIRLMTADDRVRVGELLGEAPDGIRDDFMTSLVAVDAGRILGVLRGWLGHPTGRIEWFGLDMTVPPVRRVKAAHGLLTTFEGLLSAVGATGWTAMTSVYNDAMQRLLRGRGATPTGGHLVSGERSDGPLSVTFYRRWR